MYAVNYAKPASVADAVAALSAAEDGKFLAGGMTLIPTLKQRLAAPSDLVDLGAIGELKGIALDGDALVIGAMTTHAEVARSPLVASTIPALAKVAGGIGDPQVRNVGTLGGSIANNDPAADYPGAVLGLGAEVRTNTRTIAADDFFAGMFETALEEGELIVSVRFPKPLAAAYAKFSNPASRYSMAGVFVAKTASGIRLAVTGAGAGGVHRMETMEKALEADFSPAALDPITVNPNGLNSDLHGSAAYRANLVKVMAKRAVAACA
ncbi:MAG: xanthine dehydrogenase family protein subunit M [Rhodospirillaceae bacterium]|nr:xanthine dehydrogenase family protein subunit M [Rhodospirillaceae bacterium]